MRTEIQLLVWLFYFLHKASRLGIARNRMSWKVWCFYLLFMSNHYVMPFSFPFISKDWFDCAVQAENIAVGEPSDSKSIQMRNLDQRRNATWRTGLVLNNAAAYGIMVPSVMFNSDRGPFQAFIQQSWILRRHTGLTVMYRYSIPTSYSGSFIK